MFVNITFIGTSVGLLGNCMDKKFGNSEKDEKLLSAEDLAIYFEDLAKKGDPDGCSACLEYLIGEVKNDFCVDFLIYFVTLLLIP